MRYGPQGTHARLADGHNVLNYLTTKWKAGLMRTPLPERRLVGAANIPCSDIYMIYTPQKIGWGLALYIYACLIHRMDSPVMGGTGEPYFTCNVLIPHPMIHILLSTLPLPGLHVYTIAWYEIWDTRREVQGARYGAYARGAGTWYEARGMWHAVCSM